MRSEQGALTDIVLAHNAVNQPCVLMQRMNPHRQQHSVCGISLPEYWSMSGGLSASRFPMSIKGATAVVATVRTFQAEIEILRALL